MQTDRCGGACRDGAGWGCEFFWGPRFSELYTQLDTRLMFEDLYAKVVLFDQSPKEGK